jgi:hypothetical protein
MLPTPFRLNKSNKLFLKSPHEIAAARKEKIVRQKGNFSFSTSYYFVIELNEFSF